MIKHLREAPCKYCLVQAMCFSASLDDGGSCEIELNKPCDEVIDWFLEAEIMGEWVDLNMTKQDGTILETEDIIKIIRLWGDENTYTKDEFAEIIGLDASMIIEIGRFINTLNPLYCLFDGKENMEQLLGPIVEDAIKILEKKKT